MSSFHTGELKHDTPSKAKQKTTRTTRDPFLPRVLEEQPDVPHFGMSTSCETFDQEKLQAEVTATIDVFTELLNLDRHITEHLLHRYTVF